MSTGTGATLGGKDLHSLRGTLDPIPVGVILFDPHGRPLVANRAARDLLGEVATLPVDHWADCGRFRLPGGEKAGPLDLPPCRRFATAAPGRRSSCTFEVDGDAPGPLLVAEPGRPGPRGRGRAGRVQRHTHHRAPEARAEGLPRNRFDAIGSLLAGVAGPINDALTAITGYCDLACEGLEDSHPVKGVDRGDPPGRPARRGPRPVA